MTERVFSQYLALNRHYAITAQLYKEKLITRSDLIAVKKRIDEIEMSMIVPRQKTSHHPRQLSVIK